MKNFKYIYTLLIALLLGIASFACTDDNVVGGESADDTTTKSKTITAPIEVNISAPDVSGDAMTRAWDNANIESATLENGGKFQNLVLVLADKNNNVYYIYCKKWYDDTTPLTDGGQTEYSVTLGTMKLDVATAKIYALANISTGYFQTISEYEVGQSKALSKLPVLNGLITGKFEAPDPYKLKFTPGNGYYRANGVDMNALRCTGMPVNGVSTAVVENGKVVFNVHMRRVCSRLQVTFKNNNSTPIYIDSFRIKNALSKTSKYLYDGSAPTYVGNVDFDILKAYKGSNAFYANDHKINVVEAGQSLTVSMYVLESVNGGYNYDLKVDKGSNLGHCTKYIEKYNAYVIWNSQKQRALGCIRSKKELVCTGQYDQTFSNYPQIFWQLEEDTPGTGIYALKHYNLNSISVDQKGQGYYMARQSTGKTGEVTKTVVVNPTAENKCNIVQYVYFNYSDSEECSILFCDGKNDANHMMDGVYRYLTVASPFIGSKYLENWKGDSKKANEHPDWALYSKYIIKRGEPVNETSNDIKQPIQKMVRNNSYDLTFNISTNDRIETDLYVKSIREQQVLVEGNGFTETQK